jgi:hypothetical protein
MSEENWVAVEARNRALILRDGPELWRDFKLAVENSVSTWLRIYNRNLQPEIQFSGCHEITENCFRVRTIPQPGKAGKHFEVRYDPPSGTLRVMPYKRVFAITVQPDGSLKFTSTENPGSLMGPSELDREILEPFIDALGARNPDMGD